MKKIGFGVVGIHRRGGFDWWEKAKGKGKGKGKSKKIASLGICLLEEITFRFVGIHRQGPTLMSLKVGKTLSFVVATKEENALVGGQSCRYRTPLSPYNPATKGILVGL